MNKKSIVFDFDGVVVDIKERDHAAYLHALMFVPRNKPPMCIEEYWRLRRERTDVRDIVAMSGFTGTEAALESFYRERLAVMEHPQFTSLDTLVKGVKETFEQVSRTYDIHVLSARDDVKTVSSQLEAFGLVGFVKDVAVSMHRPKHDMLSAMEDVEYIVGDTEHEIQACVGTSVKPIALATGIRTESFLLACKPHVVLPDHESLRSYLSDGRHLQKS